ncbi:MAG: cobalamin-dependent protein [Alphaproteobacteria bacterium]|nr:cobalamin-dependent protein [Alphaproteobacteria bacterium]
MDADDGLTARRATRLFGAAGLPEDLSLRFTALPPSEVADADDRRARLAGLVSDEIAPRLAALAPVLPVLHPSDVDVAELATLVLGRDDLRAAAFVSGLRDAGIPVDLLFTELLEPAAQRLGALWDSDEIDFIDVTLGVGRLQALLSVFNLTHDLAASPDRRTVLMFTLPGEQHGLGIGMVERFLEAGGWSVASERELPLQPLIGRVEEQWFAVAGLTLTDPANLPRAAAAIAAMKANSRNRALGVMVGGPLFNGNEELARRIGAHGTATSAPAAVLLAQRLLDRAIAADRTGAAA